MHAKEMATTTLARVDKGKRLENSLEESLSSAKILEEAT